MAEVTAGQGGRVNVRAEEQLATLTVAVTPAQAVVDVNLTGTMRMCMAAKPLLEKSGGAIVNTASVWSFFGGALVPAYTASKGGVAQLTKALAVAWAPTIRVNAIAPGWVETALTEGAWSDAGRSQAIIDRQRHFFEHGEVAMRPMVLREIAETLGLHESTISRVTTQKYMATPRGTYELKYFFGSHVATETGGACSATAIRALIKQLVSGEDTKAPLSDSRISQILGQQGIVVARRTIAKYRESLQIPPVNLRKSL